VSCFLFPMDHHGHPERWSATGHPPDYTIDTKDTHKYATRQRERWPRIDPRRHRTPCSGRGSCASLGYRSGREETRRQRRSKTVDDRVPREDHTKPNSTKKKKKKKVPGFPFHRCGGLLAKDPNAGRPLPFHSHNTLPATMRRRTHAKKKKGTSLHPSSPRRDTRVKIDDGTRHYPSRRRCRCRRHGRYLLRLLAFLTPLMERHSHPVPDPQKRVPRRLV